MFGLDVDYKHQCYVLFLIKLRQCTDFEPFMYAGTAKKSSFVIRFVPNQAIGLELILGPNRTKCTTLKGEVLHEDYQCGDLRSKRTCVQLCQFILAPLKKDSTNLINSPEF